MEIRDKIIQLREKKGWSQYKLFKEAKIGQSTLSRIESGERLPTAATLQKIATALGVSMAEFDENKKEAAEMLPRVMDKIEFYITEENNSELSDHVKMMSPENLEKDLAEILPIAKKIKGLSAKNKEAILTIIDSLSSDQI